LSVPLRSAAAVSLATVIASSSSVSARIAGEELINFLLGTVLEVATVAGSILGGVSARWFAESTLQRLFGVVAIATALGMLARINRLNVSDDLAVDPGPFGGRFFDPDSGRVVAYRVVRVPLALAASFVAGNISSLLGIGGVIVKV